MGGQGIGVWEVPGSIPGGTTLSSGVNIKLVLDASQKLLNLLKSLEKKF